MQKFFALAFLAATAAARAQLGVGASFSAAHISEAAADPIQTAWIYGPTFNVQYDRGGRFRFGFDARVSLLSGSGIATRSITIGPRVAVALPHLRARIYGEVLIGAMDNRPNTLTTIRTGHLDGVLAFGIERTIVPHIVWRVVDYSYADAGPFFALDTRNQFSTGILVHL